MQIHTQDGMGVAGPHSLTTFLSTLLRLVGRHETGMASSGETPLGKAPQALGETTDLTTTIRTHIVRGPIHRVSRFLPTVFRQWQSAA